jgi:hypothetical protein
MPASTSSHSPQKTDQDFPISQCPKEGCEKKRGVRKEKRGKKKEKKKISMVYTMHDVHVQNEDIQ